LRLNPIVEHTWLDYYQKLWTKQFNDNTTEGKGAKLTENCVDLITMEELETSIKGLKARKSPGSDGINNELYKHTPKSFLHKFLNFLNVCWIYGDIPEEWRTAIVMPIHKKETEITQVTIYVLVYSILDIKSIKKLLHRDKQQLQRSYC
jgi:hypothetical protein